MGLDFGRIQLHALCSEYSTKEGNLRLPDPTLQAVEDYVMLFGCLHQQEEVSFMVLGGMAIDTYIVHHNNARKMVCCLVHFHLKDILEHIQTEEHMQEPVSAMVHVEGGQIQDFPST